MTSSWRPDLVLVRNTPVRGPAVTDRSARPSAWVKALIALGLLALYLFGQPWELRGHIADVQATTLPAWHFVETGSWDLAEFQDLNPMLVETDRGVRSNRSPGIIAVAALGYGATKPATNDFENWPGTLVAVVTSWLAVLVVAASAERLRPGSWVLAVVLFGLGTATWAVAAEQLWPHGPGQLAVAIAVWFLIGRRELPAGLAFGVAVLIRPPTVLLGLGVAAVKAIGDRSIRPLVNIGGPTSVAAALFVAYTRVIFGTWNPTAPYQAVGGFWKDDGTTGSLANVVSSFFGLDHGVFIWSAWIAVCVVALVVRRPEAPRWLLWTPFIAATYVVAHSVVEVASGGLFFNYRYPLEAITLATPALALAVPGILARRGPRVLMLVAAGSALALQGSFVFLSKCGILDGEFICRLLG